MRNRGVYIGNRRDPLINEMKGFAPQGRLEAIRYVPFHLALDVDRLLPDCRIKGDRSLKRLWRGQLARSDFDQRDQVWRVERMSQDDAAGLRAAL